MNVGPVEVCILCVCVCESGGLTQAIELTLILQLAVLESKNNNAPCTSILDVVRALTPNVVAVANN